MFNLNDKTLSSLSLLAIIGILLCGMSGIYHSNILLIIGGLLSLIGGISFGTSIGKLLKK